MSDSSATNSKMKLVHAKSIDQVHDVVREAVDKGFLAGEISKRLEKDLFERFVASLDASSARTLVDLYYRIQEHRIALGNQQRATADNAITEYYYLQLNNIEESIKPTLRAYAQSQVVGEWALSQYGIGEILSAGLLAHIDISRVQTAGQIWSYAGLNPEQKWEKGEKRPWNAELKKLCYKIGDSFVKFHNREQCVYGHLYAKEKARRIDLNESGAYEELARKTLAEKNFSDSDTKKVYQAGKLPPGRIDSQARRYAVKIFLSHWFEVAYFAHNGTLPPKPWVLEHGGHAHYIPIPNIPEAQASAIEASKPKL